MISSERVIDSDASGGRGDASIVPVTNSPGRSSPRSPLRSSPRTNGGAGGASVSARVAHCEAVTAAAGIEMPTIQSSTIIPPNGRVFTTCGIDFVSRANADTYRKRVVAEYVEKQRQLKLSAICKATTVGVGVSVDVTEIRQQFEKRNSSSSIRTTTTTTTATKTPRNTHTSPPPLSRGSPRSLWSPIPTTIITRQIQQQQQQQHSGNISGGGRKTNVKSTTPATIYLSSPTLMGAQRAGSPHRLAPELRAEACDDLDLKQQQQQQQQLPTPQQPTPLLPNSPLPVLPVPAAVSELWVRLRERELATDELSARLKEALMLIETLREQVAILMAEKDQTLTAAVSTTIPATPIRITRPISGDSERGSDFSPPPPPPPPAWSAIAVVGM
jgi:hypothetical protein